MSKLIWLSQNAKMRKSSSYNNEKYSVFNFGIPAFQAKTGLKTCPNAGVCATGCYARSGTYNFSNVVSKYEARLTLTQSPEFIETLINEISIAKLYADRDKAKCLIRVHDSGDFYSLLYHKDWYNIASHFDTINFYAYTKMIQQSNDLKIVQPSNFNLIYSLGGKQDQLINIETDRHSKVFESETDLLERGYIDATQNDLIAAIGPNPKIGLVFHHQKSYKNTAWNRVAK